MFNKVNIIKGLIIIVCLSSIYTSTMVILDKLVQYNTTIDVDQIYQDVRLAAGEDVKNIELVIIEDSRPSASTGLNVFNQPVVMITTGMLYKIKNQEGMSKQSKEAQIAFIFGHEISHHILGHISMMRVHHKHNQIAKMNLPKFGKYPYLNSPMLEYNSDRLGMYIAHMAGYGKCGSKDYWYYELKTEGDYITPTTHPSHSSRYVLGYNYCNL